MYKHTYHSYVCHSIWNLTFFIKQHKKQALFAMITYYNSLKFCLIWQRHINQTFCVALEWKAKQVQRKLTSNISEDKFKLLKLSIQQLIKNFWTIPTILNHVSNLNNPLISLAVYLSLKFEIDQWQSDITDWSHKKS